MRDIIEQIIENEESGYIVNKFSDNNNTTIDRFFVDYHRHIVEETLANGPADILHHVIKPTVAGPRIICECTCGKFIKTFEVDKA